MCISVVSTLTHGPALDYKRKPYTKIQHMIGIAHFPKQIHPILTTHSFVATAPAPCLPKAQTFALVAARISSYPRPWHSPPPCLPCVVEIRHRCFGRVVWCRTRLENIYRWNAILAVRQVILSPFSVRTSARTVYWPCGTVSIMSQST